MENELKIEIMKWFHDFINNAEKVEDNSEVLNYFITNIYDLRYFSELSRQFNYDEKTQNKETKFLKETVIEISGQTQTAPPIILLNIFNKKLEIIEELEFSQIDSQKVQDKITEFIFSNIRMLCALIEKTISNSDKFTLNKDQLESSQILYNEILEYFENFDNIMIPLQHEECLKVFIDKKEQLKIISEKCLLHKFSKNENEETAKKISNDYLKDVKYNSTVKNSPELVVCLYSLNMIIIKNDQQNIKEYEKTLSKLCAYVWHMPMLYGLLEEYLNLQEKYKLN